jgi:AcrR family transcriptional regulator
MDKSVGKVLTKRDIRTRDAGAKGLRILLAAKREFSRLGLGGARIDAIADRAKVNKRTVYQYFRSKDALFRAVLENAYHDLKVAERALELEKLPPEIAINTLVESTWFYYLKNIAILTLINSENLHKGRHLKTSISMKNDYRHAQRNPINPTACARVDPIADKDLDGTPSDRRTETQFPERNSPAFNIFIPRSSGYPQTTDDRSILNNWQATLPSN